MSRIEISAALPEVKLGKITTIFFKFILRILISVWLTATLVDQNSWSPSLLASALEDVRCSLTLHARPLCRLLADRCSYPAALHFTSGYLHWKQHSHGEKVQRAGAACGHVHRAGGENMQVLTPTTNWGALLSEPPQAAYCFSALGPAGCAKKAWFAFPLHPDRVYSPCTKRVWGAVKLGVSLQITCKSMEVLAHMARLGRVELHVLSALDEEWVVNRS